MSSPLDAIKAALRAMPMYDEPTEIRYYAAGPNGVRLAKALGWPDDLITVLPKLPTSFPGASIKRVYFDG